MAARVNPDEIANQQARIMLILEEQTALSDRCLSDLDERVRTIEQTVDKASLQNSGCCETIKHTFEALTPVVTTLASIVQVYAIVFDPQKGGVKPPNPDS